MSTRIRQDELLRILRRRGSLTVAGLTESLEVSRRTVLRGIADLRDQGFVIHTEPGRGGGVYLDPTSILVSPKLTSSEVFALLLSVAVLKQLHPLPFTQLADAGLKKIEQALPRDRVLEMRRILRNVYIGQPDPALPLPQVQDIKATVLPDFETCFLQAKTMRFRYTDSRGRITTRCADPHALLVLSPAWYMIGYDIDKREFRHFRLDRIGSSSVQSETFKRRKFSVAEGECPFSTSFV